jgi:hypothetical protein
MGVQRGKNVAGMIKEAQEKYGKNEGDVSTNTGMNESIL